ncbi:hypothetical protein Prum_075740 [Phytohabitans rumicis]|uniref:Uncharacterized protein n=1 Tax=Phytohabitans rumicis TaxID=1076125 RepID=A0A6V8L9M9_9ACTN|nr:hypothetical protein Prum_075740 [Phytohabitans rumicis]
MRLSDTSASPEAGHATVAGCAPTTAGRARSARGAKSLTGTDFSVCVAGARHSGGSGAGFDAAAGSATSRLPAITAAAAAAIHFFTVSPQVPVCGYAFVIAV